jgi:uncharacterized protein YqjF (DUF2071 family)
MAARRRADRIEYSSDRLDASGKSFLGTYRPLGDVFGAERDSLEWFLTERYCLYAVDGGQLLRADIQHPPWPLQAAELSLEHASMAPAPLRLDGPPLCHFARRQDVLIWPLRNL